MRHHRHLVGTALLEDAGTVPAMVDLHARHFRGATVHSDRACTPTARLITVTDQFLPTRDGNRETWHPCVKCGTPLVLDLADAVPADGSWLVAMYPVDEDTQSWQLYQRPMNADLLRDLAEHRGLQVAPWDTGVDVLSDSLEVEVASIAVIGSLPWAVLDVLGNRFITQPLPNRAVIQQAVDPAGFAVTAAVLSRIAAADERRARLATAAAKGAPAWVESMRAWGEDAWSAAEAIAAPAAVS